MTYWRVVPISRVRSTIARFALATALAVLAGCGGGGGGGEAVAQPPADAQPLAWGQANWNEANWE